MPGQSARRMSSSNESLVSVPVERSKMMPVWWRKLLKKTLPMEIERETQPKVSVEHKQTQTPLSESVQHKETQTDPPEMFITLYYPPL